MSKGADTRRTILDQALATATELGLEALSIGSLARQAGMSKSGLFAHFSSKENLQLAVLETAAERFVQFVVEPAFKVPRGERRVRALFAKWMEWDRAGFQPGGCLFIAVANELADRPGPVRDCLVETQQRWLATLAKTVRIAVQEGDFSSDVDPDQIAFDLFGIVLSYHFHRHVLRDPNADDRVEHAFESVLDACRAPQS